MKSVSSARRSYIKGVAVYIAVVLLSATAIWLLSSDARKKIDALAVANADSTQWSLAQSEVEYLALITALQKATGDVTQFGDVRRRFDVFYSRIQTIRASSAFDGVRELPIVAAALTDIEVFLTNAIPQIDGDDSVLVSSTPQLLGELDALRPKLRDISLEGVRIFSHRSEIQRKSVASALSDLGWIVFGLLALLLAVVGFLLVNMRASQRQTSEIALTQSRLQAIISTSLDGILVVGKNGEVLDYNGAAEGIFGYSREEALGEDMANLIVPDHLRDMHNAGMARYRGEGSKRVVGSGLLNLEAKRKDGSVFPVELSINSAESEDGEIFVSFLRDISQRVAGEKELVEARDKALAGEKAKADLLAVMSHEMRTPLNGVLGTLQLLSGTNLTPQQEKYVGVMGTSGTLLLEHVNNVLDISRVDSGKIEIAQVEFDLLSLTRNVVDGLSSQAESRGNTMSIARLGDPPRRVVGDEVRVRQILFNLLGNAIKFTENGSVTLEIEAIPDSDHIEFRVADSGIGISEGNLDRIFEDFVTLDATYQREVEGTGLGLGIVKRLVRLLGGEIGVESEHGDGSVFWFRIPLPQAAIRNTSIPLGESKAPQQFPAKVLVVEDNEINRMVVGEMLSQHGCDVTEAQDGHEGVLLAGNVAFDLILMDISMPKVDGVTAAKTIKSEAGPNQSTPIVALTAHAMPGDFEKFKEAGMRDVITKPISAEKLRDVLSELNDASFVAKQVPSQMQELSNAFGVEKAAALMEKAKKQLVDGFDELERLVTAHTEQEDISALAHKLAGTAAMFEFEPTLIELRNIENASSSASQAELMQSIDSGRNSLRDLLHRRV